MEIDAQPSNYRHPAKKGDAAKFLMSTFWYDTQGVLSPITLPASLWIGGKARVPDSVYFKTSVSYNSNIQGTGRFSSLLAFDRYHINCIRIASEPWEEKFMMKQ
jgi:hypothetical protein